MRAQQRRRWRAGQFCGAQADPAAAAAVRAALFQGSEPASARLCVPVAQWSLKGCQRRVAIVCHTQLGARLCLLSPVFASLGQQGAGAIGAQRDSPVILCFKCSGARFVQSAPWSAPVASICCTHRDNSVGPFRHSLTPERRLSFFQQVSFVPTCCVLLLRWRRSGRLKIAWN